MSDFKVTVNKVVGEEAENANKCTICKRLCTTATLGREEVCKTCLRVADVAISRALCPQCARPPYNETPTAGGHE